VTSNGVEPDHATASGGVRTRATRQRVAVAAALAVADGFRTAQEIHRMLADQGDRVGLTTVYRHLAALVDSGEVDVLRADDGEALYRACATVEHHHHVLCRRCGATVEVAGDVVEQWAERVARAAGFGEITHQLEIFGVCRACRGGD
jgi:Fur family ferric uptake transcriptional regulator